MQVPVESITFHWKEGVTRQKFPLVVHSFSEANALLKNWAKDAPMKGYDKVSYTVQWANGDTYTGRFDLHNIKRRQETPSGRIDLGEAIQTHLKFVAGRVSGELKERREAIIRRFPEYIKRELEAVKMLDTLSFNHSSPGNPVKRSPPEDEFYWSGKEQDLVVKGYGLPTNPKTNLPEWSLMELGDAHPKELHRLFFQCMHQGLGTYKGKHRPFTVEACKLIASACYSKDVCKKGMGVYREAFHREKLLTSERLPTGLKRR